MFDRLSHLYSCLMAGASVAPFAHDTRCEILLCCDANQGGVLHIEVKPEEVVMMIVGLRTTMVHRGAGPEKVIYIYSAAQ